MLRQNLSFLLVCLALCSFGQTYFYAHALVVNPANPTSIDNISIDVFGDFSASNSVITNTAFSVNGFEVYLTLDCASPGVGSTVLVPHTETITIGALPPGNYHINLLGTSLGDFVMDTTDYYFTVLGPQSIETLTPEIDNEYDVRIDADSGLVMIEQNSDGPGIEVVQIIDMKGSVIKEVRPGNTKEAQIALSPDHKGIFLVSIKSGEKVWSDIFSRPK